MGDHDAVRVLELAHHLRIPEDHLLGEPLPPAKHTHYAADGVTVTGYTVVEQPSPWNDARRARMLALLAYQDGRCRGCGTHQDEDLGGRAPDSRVCGVCAALDVHKRVTDLREHDAREAAEKHTGNPDADIQKAMKRQPWDGRTLTLRPLTPDEQAARQRQQHQGQPAHQSNSQLQRARKGV